MVPLTMLSVVLIGAMCALAYTLATYALPFLFAVTVTRLAFATGAGFVGAGIVGLFAGVAAYGLLAYLVATLRSPGLSLVIALIFAIPAAIAGYALVHGITREAIPSEIWRQTFCVAGGIFVGLSALSKLANPSRLHER
ncbi:hypothetical protein [Agrobacterium vitis]|uniref:hypothetical protein n=1 Tax=Agrobacterium vitis TaxID=373 RepID=UPI00076174DE|nr:hypothetical protein [Agrobacterium vitis]KAA3503748.1 hypothetical protein DXM22_25670 [Agrobacterium vitis]NOJ33034.1 hypothetical protein [Agrobacterium vitis]RCU53404.1 hypothetical protein ASB66_017390 [Agrobacterium vitis]